MKTFYLHSLVNKTNIFYISGNQNLKKIKEKNKQNRVRLIKKRSINNQVLNQKTR